MSLHSIVQEQIDEWWHSWEGIQLEAHYQQWRLTMRKLPADVPDLNH